MYQPYSYSKELYCTVLYSTMLLLYDDLKCFLLRLLYLIVALSSSIRISLSDSYHGASTHSNAATKLCPKTETSCSRIHLLKAADPQLTRKQATIAMAQTNAAFLAPALPLKRCFKRNKHAPSLMRLPDIPQLESNLSKLGLTIDPHNEFGSHISAICTNPPLLRVSNFLSPSQCAALIKLQTDVKTESDLYLNYRVNQQVTSSAESAEAAKLIEEYSASRASLTSSMRSGFRAQISPTATEMQPVLKRTRELLGFAGREFVFEEGLWRRPNRRSVVVRDQTTVKYEVGEGVAPHVDGKDVTVLICLEAAEEGGRTVFPEEGLAVKGEVGSAIVYQSKKGMLHFGEAVVKGRKWVLQLLIDFQIRQDEKDIDYSTGMVYC
eukprot:GFKZ01012337.1.p1 GENE.GFKZ01012337.1~~GFKZ01012337.1.p1  ORF type:complete len:380 (-),score=46.89 GFKZ01012337.1:444-1583(-)